MKTEALAMVLVVLLVVAVVATIVIFYPGEAGSTNNTPSSSTTTSNSASSTGPTSVSTTCVIAGQPGGIYLAVLYDATQLPLIGAKVVVTNEPATCDGQPATTRTSLTYTSNYTMWEPLPSDNNARYDINVTWAGQSHTFTADLDPVSLTCAKILLPSGTTNVTIREFGETCNPTAPANPGKVYPAAYSLANTNGLDLGLKLNSTVIAPGESVAITLTELNSLDKPFNAATKSFWPFLGLSLGPCGTYDLPYGIMVLRGYTDTATTSNLMQWYAPGPAWCPAELGSISSYLFQPLSTSASIYGSCTSEPCTPTQPLNSTFSVLAEWVGGFSYPLPTGIYTVIAGDEWGAWVTAHFVVAEQGSALPFNGTEMIRASALGPVPPFNPSGPLVALSLNNNGFLPITSMQAEFDFGNVSSSVSDVFHFDVNASNPLVPGQKATTFLTLFNEGFQSWKTYMLLINGTFEGGTSFQTTTPVAIYPLIYAVPNGQGGYCQGPGGYDICLGGNYTTAERFDCATQATTPMGCTWKVVLPSAPQMASEMTVWYPYSISSQGPWFFNCRYVDSGDPTNYYYAYCIFVNSTSFVVAQPEGGPV
jgi:hypothetical protein